MRISARNVIKGNVKRVIHGAVNSEVTIGFPGPESFLPALVPVKTGREILPFLLF